ncbi:NFATC2-interacting protein isoform X2 [Latimeria chalumnae]|uniref:NFATC2-interacting protein isoform X2 n=1 Tax=Latimeria chalumnae TaxID=7897 RepID=UPI0003C19A40|nr:PREDICTED: NFATC2-interacting protein isoform X2 [Latimeria chalumnae]|eukprot:XP_006009853.1 PREDICTED: NFATC2-interacting protein isoform X2 [Latimeria chalumnae]
MAEQDDASSGSDVELVVPRPQATQPPRAKRRKIIDSSSIATVPVYSNKVNSSLKLYADNPGQLEQVLKSRSQRAESDSGWNIHLDERNPNSVSMPGEAKQNVCELLESDEEAEQCLKAQPLMRDKSPSPPPTPDVSQKYQGRAYFKIREVNKKLNNLAAFQIQARKTPLEDDDVCVLGSTTIADLAREITVKVQCRTDVFRIPLLTTDPLQKVVNQMASQLQVSPDKILLLQRDVELSPEETPYSLKLTVADIIECIVVSDASDQQEAVVKGTAEDDEICLRVKGKEKNSLQIISVRKTDPLKKLMDEYKERMGLKGQKVTFLFDGEKLSNKSTAKDHDMEMDDVIDVWL